MFFDNFFTICTSRGTTPSAACRDIGLQPNRASKWKHKGSIPTEEEMIALAAHLDCRVSDFFADDDLDCLSVENIDESELDGEEEDLLRIYRSLSKRNKIRLMGLVYDFEDSVGEC